jgi:pimeloyl-ACP methyl ester carboxylesterase
VAETITRKTVEAGGFHTTYIEAGNAHNPALILLHDGGYGTTAELCWGRMAEILANHFHVLAPDLLGWGGTDKAVFLDRSPYQPRINHVAAFCRELGVRQASFAGASFGGSLILRALSDGASGWPVSKAVIISGTGGPYRTERALEAQRNYRPSLAEARQFTALHVDSMNGLDGHVFKRHENSLIPGHWEAMQAQILRNPSLDGATKPDPYPETLRSVRVPVLFIEGKHDQLLERGWAKKIAEFCPTGRVCELDAAHEPNIDRPGELVAHITKFLGL